ncbi:MAG: hypothetical protein ACTSYE_06280, partial [Alphaproteobacteria bacterium]
MIYTVGLTHKYERELARGPLRKLGPQRQADGNMYPGGWVWQSAADAKAYLVERKSTSIRSVYGVEADWERDTSEAPGKTYR